MMSMGEVVLFILGVLAAIVILALAGFAALWLISGATKVHNEIKEREKHDK